MCCYTINNDTHSKAYLYVYKKYYKDEEWREEDR